MDKRVASELDEQHGSLVELEAKMDLVLDFLERLVVQEEVATPDEIEAWKTQARERAAARRRRRKERRR